MAVLEASGHAGRLRGLAVVLGLGTAMLSGAAAAAADTGSQESSAAVDRGSRSARDAGRPERTSVAPARAAAAARQAPRRATAKPAAAGRVAADGGGATDMPRRARLVAGTAGATASRDSATSAEALSSVPNPAALPPRVSPFMLRGVGAATVIGVLPGLLTQLAIGVHLGPSKSAFNQTVSLNGYDMVPTSTELVASFYGPWTYAPGGLNIVGGRQDYAVVDPATQERSGSFTALVSSGKPLGLTRYAQLLVTSAEGDVGTGAGQTPPVGSVIANLRIIGDFGWNYSAMPSESGDIVSMTLTTPFGEIPLRFLARFDGAKGIADHTVDNRPIDLGNGYSIAPSDPDGETYTATSGLMPVYQAIQTRQQFDVRDSSGVTVGTFDGVATTTWDIGGIYTEAVQVTESHGDNVGTGVGQVPPAGTVYNVVYVRQDTRYVLYTSMPSPSGDVISLIQARTGEVSNILTFPIKGFNASAPPPVRRLPIPGGYGILPISDMAPFGVNGLPPRDVIVQGYRRFAVYDRDGVRQGTFDALVSQQWDLLGISSQAILVTKVTDGRAGTSAGDIPPVGSVLNYLYVGRTGFGTSYWSLPSPTGTKISYKILTPLIDIPTWSTYNASAGIDTVTFADPV